MKKVLFALSLMLSLTLMAQQQPKREFRGAWIQCVNGQFIGKTPSQIRLYLATQLDDLASAGINAIFFQVRPEGDALYKSKFEPWSRYLMGEQGVAPADGWDPLEWMVAQCHERGMECHAWINPYRAKTKGTAELHPSHQVIKHPERVFDYDGLKIFNPAIEANRLYTCMVVEDIIRNYDVDGIHMDDYFYPYPVEGVEIPDENYFNRNPRGFNNIEDWRRDNVNMLIRNLHDMIREIKPWIKFGVSPFGIYRNSPTGTNCREGSATSGLQNYDQLYADVVLWQKEGWVDYTVPQIYWNVGTAAADYEVLCHWWNDYCNDRPLFIGQDVDRTVAGVDPNDSTRNQQCLKLDIQRSLPNVQGSCMWYAAAVANNTGGYRDVLEEDYHRYPALQPQMKWLDSKAPKAPTRLRLVGHNGKVFLVWNAPKAKKELDKVCQFVVYRFLRGEKVDLDDPSHIVEITPRDLEARGGTFVLDGDPYGETYVVTSLDRLGNESKGARLKIK